jgi:eukaryotic-like serine/threonine-protein kinase
MARVRGAAPIAVGMVATALLVGLLGFSSTLNPLDAVLGRGAIVTVPDLTGRPRPGAEAEARSAGLVPEVRTSFSLTGKRGTVISQDPLPGSRVREDSTVRIVVSRGVRRVAMPDAVGKPVAEVTAPLREADVKVRVSKVASETVAAGLVISQDPGAGVVVSGDDTAKFVVSEGPVPRPVPAVSGVALAGASFQIGKAGLTIGTVTETDDPSVLVGAVVRTDPAGGTVVARDTPVNVAVSAGPPPVPLPNLVGSTADAAGAALTAAGFVPNVVYQGSGTVATQQPVAGTPARPGSVVTVTIGGA